MTTRLEPIKKALGIYRHYFALLAQHPMILASLLVISLLASISEVMGVSLLIPLLQDVQSEGGSLSDLPVLGYLGKLASNMTLVGRMRFVAVALVVIFVTRGIFIFGARLLSLLLQIAIERDLSKKVFNQILDLELRFFHKERIGNVFTILTNYTRIAGGSANLAARSVIDMFFLLMYAAMVCLLSWQLSLIAVAMLLISFFLIRKPILTRISQAGVDVTRATAKLNSVGIETLSLSAIKLIHLFCREKRSNALFNGTLQEYLRHVFRSSRLSYLVGPILSILNAVIIATLLVMSTFLLKGHVASWIGLMVLFLVIMYRLQNPVTQLNEAYAALTNQYPALKSVLCFLRRKDKPYLANGDQKIRGIRSWVAFEDVTFRYGPDGTPALENVSVEIPKGKITAVVGPSGAGKTTLVDLVARLFDPQQGRITVDGVDIRDLDITSWRALLGVVSQETFLFNDSVGTNLRFAKEEATEAEIQHAAKLANAHDFIVALPQGYETLLGDRGVRLSGGQRQRIGIARALLADPQLLILDEATSSVDTETELQIQQAIERVSRGRTVLAIAHRLSTIRKADNIIVLDESRVVEQGNHDALMQQRGRYWKLVQMQDLGNLQSDVEIHIGE